MEEHQEFRKKSTDTRQLSPDRHHQHSTEKELNRLFWDNCVSTCKQMRLEPSLIPHTKIYPKWTDNSKRKALRENIGLSLHDLGSGKEFLDMTPRERVTKGKLERLDFTKTKIFCASKDITKKKKEEEEKITYRVGENICQSYT